MLHLDEAFAGHIDAIQGQLQKLDRTVGDLSQVQNSAVVNTEQFSRILYGLYVVTAAVKFPQAPDSLALKQATEPSAKTALVPTQATLPPQPRIQTNVTSRIYNAVLIYNSDPKAYTN